jgi:hypothetical protein
VPGCRTLRFSGYGFFLPSKRLCVAFFSLLSGVPRTNVASSSSIPPDLSPTVIPTGVAGIFLRTAVWCAGHGVEGPRQPIITSTTQRRVPQSA